MPDDSLNRAILAVLAASTVGGVLAVLAGEYLIASPALQTAGLGLAVISGGAYFFMRWLGRREARRRGGGQGGGGE